MAIFVIITVIISRLCSIAGKRVRVLIIFFIIVSFDLIETLFTCNVCSCVSYTLVCYAVYAGRIY